jgi:hypothetical protein
MAEEQSSLSPWLTVLIMANYPHHGKLSSQWQKKKLHYIWLFLPWMTILIIAYYLINDRKSIFNIGDSFHNG